MYDKKHENINEKIKKWYEKLYDKLYEEIKKLQIILKMYTNTGVV